MKFLSLTKTQKNGNVDLINKRPFTNTKRPSIQVNSFDF
jgi:hypothetical protein